MRDTHYLLPIKRAIAFIIDLLIISFIFGFFIPEKIIRHIIESTTNQIETVHLVQSEYPFIILAIFIFSIIYFSFFDLLTASSPGKYVFGMKTVKEENQKLKLSILQSLSRSTLKIISATTGPIIIFILILMQFDKKKQTLYDKVCKSIVIDKKNNAPNKDVDQDNKDSNYWQA